MSLPYIKCDPCMDGDHDNCLGMKLTEPICACSICPWVQLPWTQPEGEHDDPPTDGGSTRE